MTAVLQEKNADAVDGSHVVLPVGVAGGQANNIVHDRVHKLTSKSDLRREHRVLEVVDKVGGRRDEHGGDVVGQRSQVVDQGLR